MFDRINDKHSRAKNKTLSLGGRMKETARETERERERERENWGGSKLEGEGDRQIERQDG